ncbi:hypothetical protein BDW68DRAFT_179210 [Aspergillus falconensis]
MTGAGPADGGHERRKEKGKWKVDSIDDLSSSSSSNGNGKSSSGSNAAPQPGSKNLPPPPPPALGPVYIEPPSADIPVLLWTLEFAGSIIAQLSSELTRGTWKGGDSAGYTGVSSAAVNTAKARTITSTTCTTTAAAAATSASTHSVAAATRTGAINTDKTITTVRTATA